MVTIGGADAQGGRLNSLFDGVGTAADTVGTA